MILPIHGVVQWYDTMIKKQKQNTYAFFFNQQIVCCFRYIHLQHSKQPNRMNRLRMRKGRSVVHKNLEDNYGAVVVANHEALAQVLEQVSTIHEYL